MKEKLRQEIIAFRKRQPSEWALRHLKVVVKASLDLAVKYPEADKDIVEAGAWLHDVGHRDLQTIKTRKTDVEQGHHLRSKKLAAEFLPTTSFPKEKIPAVLHCIEAHRTRTLPEPNSLEAKIVASADNSAHIMDSDWLV